LRLFHHFKMWDLLSCNLPEDGACRNSQRKHTRTKISTLNRQFKNFLPKEKRSAASVRLSPLICSGACMGNIVSSLDTKKDWFSFFEIFLPSTEDFLILWWIGMIPQEFYAHSQSRISLLSSVLSGEGCVCSGRDDNICLTHKYQLHSFCVNGCKWNGVACFI
jgi:hypothetical protein